MERVLVDLETAAALAFQRPINALPAMPKCCFQPIFVVQIREICVTFKSRGPVPCVPGLHVRPRALL